NLKDNGRRRFILVQLPEELNPENPDQKTAADYCDHIGKPRNVAELSKERIRRVGANIREEYPLARDLDIGFRVLKVDTSNMEDVYYRPGELDQDRIPDLVDNIKPDRSAEDLLFQVLIDWGVDLTLPIARETIEGKDVYFVDENALVACFERGVTEE